MTTRNTTTLWRAVALAALIAVSGLPHPAFAQKGDDKATRTPYFWQCDPKANFADKGSNYCAPSAIADGLVYLTRTRGLDDLVASTDHDGQIKLISDLATAMDTDPTKGTNPDQIVSGLLRYAGRRGYSFERLELSTWRGVGADNRKYLVGTKPDLRWMTAATRDPDAVVVFNFGWYKKASDGTYKRLSGHWVNVVGAGARARQFDIRNPYLEPRRQQTDTAIALAPIGNDFVFVGADGKKSNMAGYYQAEGPGLPFSKKAVSAALLDSVIVFKIRTG